MAKEDAEDEERPEFGFGGVYLRSINVRDWKEN